MQIALNLLLNTSLLLSISIIFNLFYQRILHQKVLYKLIGGVIIGLVGIVLMTISIKLPNNVIFDTRSILLSVAGLFYGVIPTSIAALIVVVYRIFLGGPGVYAGIAVSVTSAAIGILWRTVRKKPEKLSKFEYYGLGLSNHIVMLLCMFLLPKEIIGETLKSISLPVLTIYPLGSFLMCMIITYESESLQMERRLTESEIRFQAVCEQAPVGITVETPQQIFYANSEYASIVGMPAMEIRTADWQSLTHQGDLKKEMALRERMLSGEIDKYDLIKRYVHKNKEVTWIHLFAAILHRDVDTDKCEYICIVQDITKEIERENSLVESERRQREMAAFLTTLLDAIPDHIYYKNTAASIWASTKPLRRRPGISRE